MQPNSEPTPTDIQMVQAAMDGTPQPEAPAPTAQPMEALQQPEPVTPQPAPTQQTTDPFANLFASEPAATPAEPVAQVAEPVVEPAPVEAPAQTPAPQDDYQTYDDYMASVLAGVPDAPASPDPETIDSSDPAAIKGFFDDLMNTAVARAQHETQRANAIQSAEKRAWDNSFEKYPSLKTNKDLRDMVHSIRMSSIHKGIAITPTQAAEKLLTSLGASYSKGVADNQVITTYESVQATGGGTGEALSTSLDTAKTLESVQVGGEAALAALLDTEIKNGRTW